MSQQISGAILDITDDFAYTQYMHCLWHSRRCELSRIGTQDVMKKFFFVTNK